MFSVPPAKYYTNFCITRYGLLFLWFWLNYSRSIDGNSIRYFTIPESIHVSCYLWGHLFPWLLIWAIPSRRWDCLRFQICLSVLWWVLGCRWSCIDRELGRSSSVVWFDWIIGKGWCLVVAVGACLNGGSLFKLKNIDITVYYLRYNLWVN